MSERIEDISIMRNDSKTFYDNELLQGHHKDLVRSMRVAALLWSKSMPRQDRFRPGTYRQALERRPPNGPTQFHARPTLRHRFVNHTFQLSSHVQTPCEGLSSVPYIVEVRCMACQGRPEVSNCQLKQRPMWRPPAPRISRRLPIRACADGLDAPRSSFIATARVIPITSLSQSHSKHSERTYYGNYAS
jgi:hypothetical protein